VGRIEARLESTGTRLASKRLSERILNMESRAKLLGHPIHQMLIVFPVGLLATASAFDLIHVLADSRAMVSAAYWTLSAGLVGALVAMPFGTIDWLAIPADTRAKRIGAMHGIGNVVVSLLYVASWFLRPDSVTPPGTAALALSFVGAGLLLVTGWLGAELVSRLGVGVTDRATLNTPSSLRTTVNKP
jgi:uncharacterized membrane protein